MITPTISVTPTFEMEMGRFIATVPERRLQKPFRWGLPEWFAVAQVAGPAILYLPGTQPFRAPLRVGVFALSLLGLFWSLRVIRVNEDSSRMDLACDRGRLHGDHDFPSSHQYHDGGHGADRNAPCRRGTAILGTRGTSTAITGGCYESSRYSGS